MLPGRTTALLVGGDPPNGINGIIEWDQTTWASLDPFIDVANDMVTECCVVSASVSPQISGLVLVPYPDHRLELIERWLAAHFYALADPRTTEERAGEIMERFESKVDLRLDSTRYGQMAMILDTQGGLASINNASKTIKRPKMAGVLYLGVPNRRTQFDTEDTSGAFDPTFPSGPESDF